jgi:hypothetical protein
MSRKLKRMGLATPEWFCILGGLGLAVLIGAKAVGFVTSLKYGDTDEMLQRQVDAGASSSNTTHGNNGVGNGIDPAPPGSPPENDGVGTEPGNPGNRGGAWK